MRGLEAPGRQLQRKRGDSILRKVNHAGSHAFIQANAKPPGSEARRERLSCGCWTGLFAVTTIVAFVTARSHPINLYSQWMAMSYAVTFSFVSDRVPFEFPFFSDTVGMPPPYFPPGLKLRKWAFLLGPSTRGNDGISPPETYIAGIQCRRGLRA